MHREHAVLIPDGGDDAGREVVLNREHARRGDNAVVLAAPQLHAGLHVLQLDTDPEDRTGAPD